MRRRFIALAVGVGAGLLSSGCDLLAAPGFDDDFGKPLGSYETGRATLEIDGTTIVLDRLSTGPHLVDGMGADVYWYNEDGWGLRLSTYDGGWMSGSDITIDRVRTTYWSAPGYGACKVTLEVADETGAKGSATCTGLRWVEQLRAGRSWSEEQPYVEGEPAFDATVTFEAAPANPAAWTGAPARGAA